MLLNHGDTNIIISYNIQLYSRTMRIFVYIKSAVDCQACSFYPFVMHLNKFYFFEIFENTTITPGNNVST